jgi:hypothetical protein
MVSVLMSLSQNTRHEVRFLRPLRFQIFYPLNDCLTLEISGSQKVQGLVNKSGCGSSSLPNLTIFFLENLCNISFGVVMLKIYFTAGQALFNDFRLKFFICPGKILRLGFTGNIALINAF